MGTFGREQLTRSKHPGMIPSSIVWPSGSTSKTQIDKWVDSGSSWWPSCHGIIVYCSSCGRGIQFPSKQKCCANGDIQGDMQCFQVAFQAGGHNAGLVTPGETTPNSINLRRCQAANPSQYMVK